MRIVGRHVAACLQNRRNALNAVHQREFGRQTRQFGRGPTFNPRMVDCGCGRLREKLHCRDDYPPDVEIALCLSILITSAFLT